MKQLKLFACLAFLLLGACTGKKSSPDLVNMEQNDSLQRIIAQRDSEINDMMSTLNEIQEGLSAINQAENRLSIAREGEGANKTAQIKENIKFIANTMARNRELMKRLQQQLRESRFNGDELRKTISNLTQQLDDKAQELQRLKAELDAKDIHIAELDEKIAYLQVTPVQKYAMKHLPKDEIASRVLSAAEILQITEYLDRKPKALSGGQCQRVALGRAIVRNAKVFLMDEPLSNLDAKLRVQMRSEIIKLHNRLNATTIYVTHDQTEAMTMATRIVVMNKGYIQQIGTPVEIYNHPANLFVATFIGSPAMNLFPSTFKNGSAVFEDGLSMKLAEGTETTVRAFYENELASYIKEKDTLLAEFKERNLLLEKLEHLRSLPASPKTDHEISETEFEIEQVTRSNERLSYLENAIAKYQGFLAKGEFDTVFGIRPEDIYEQGKAYTDGMLSDPISGIVSVPELLGHEYFVHINFENRDLVAKIAAKRLINAEEEIQVVLDLSRAHLFDAVSSKIIE